MQPYVLRVETPRIGRHIRELLDRDLNAEQRAVVLEGKGPVLVVAGAGSGKTRTLIYRAAYLLDQGLPLERLLVCTFSQRAARSMINRLESLLKISLKKFWAGTFHHIANLALRQHASRLGLSSDYSILDREDSRDLWSSVLNDVRQTESGGAALPEGSVIANLTSLAVNQNLSVAEYIQTKQPKFLPLADTIIEVARRYALQKMNLSLLDYDDLLFMFKILLSEHGDIREQLAGRFEHVLVDEFQDTNPLQAELVGLCASVNGNLTVVGDDAQSIYGFRGANVENMLAFKTRYPDAKIHILQQNYRSTPQILRFANQSISQNQHRFVKDLAATKPAGSLPVILPLTDATQQAEFVCQRIGDLRAEGVALDDIAVLYRAHAHSLELQVELTRRGIPYDVRSGLRFFEQAHIKDVLAFLRVIVNTRDILAWARVLHVWPGLGNKSRERILNVLGDPSGAIDLTQLEQVLSRAAFSSLKKCLKLVGDLRDEMQNEKGPGSGISAVVENCYADYARRTFSNAETRLEDISQLSAYAGRYQSYQPLLSDLTLLGGVAAEVSLNDVNDDNQQRLTLSSIHQAKGLEWHTIFALHLTEGHFPSPASIAFDHMIEEERRLFHVLCTRAREQLYLCQPQFEDRANGPRRLLRRSRFLSELDGASTDPLFELWAIEERAI